MTTTTPSLRIDYLDAVRAFALLLGIVFHASLSFMPFFIGWAVMDISTSPLVGAFVLISHSFRMELFFLIAGFFSHMAFHKKGGRAFLGSRLVRILVPFLVGWCLLYPLLVASWVMGTESMRGDVNVLNGLKAGWQALLAFDNPFVGSHLWFLYYLLLITGAALLGRLLVSLWPTLRNKTSAAVDVTLAWVVRSRFSWFIVAVPTTASLWYMRDWGMDTPDKSLVPHIPVFLVYGGFFVFGWIMHRQPALMEAFSRITVARVVLCVVSIGLCLGLVGFQTQPAHPRFDLIRGGFLFSYAIMMWSLVALSIGLFRVFLSEPNKAVRYFADASYWLYLIHLPIVMFLQIAFAELPWHWSIKLASITLLTVAISLVLYDLLVRTSFIGKMLNGRTKPRVLFALRDKSSVLGPELSKEG